METTLKELAEVPPGMRIISAAAGRELKTVLKSDEEVGFIYKEANLGGIKISRYYGAKWLVTAIDTWQRNYASTMPITEFVQFMIP